jgi:hypothetical protein
MFLRPILILSSLSTPAPRFFPSGLLHLGFPIKTLYIYFFLLSLKNIRSQTAPFNMDASTKPIPRLVLNVAAKQALNSCSAQPQAIDPLTWEDFRCLLKISKTGYNLLHICPSFCPHWTVPLSLDRFSWKSIFEDSRKICRRNFHWNLPRITGTSH